MGFPLRIEIIWTVFACEVRPLGNKVYKLSKANVLVLLFNYCSCVNLHISPLAHCLTRVSLAEHFRISKWYIPPAPKAHQRFVMIQVNNQNTVL